MQTMNIALPDQLKEFIRDRVAQGGYTSVSEYMRELIRTDQKRRATETLEAEILKGLGSGPPTPITPDDFKALKRKLRSRKKRDSR